MCYFAIQIWYCSDLCVLFGKRMDRTMQLLVQKTEIQGKFPYDSPSGSSNSCTVWYYPCFVGRSTKVQKCWFLVFRCWYRFCTIWTFDDFWLYFWQVFPWNCIQILHEKVQTSSANHHGLVPSRDKFTRFLFCTRILYSNCSFLWALAGTKFVSWISLICR